MAFQLSFDGTTVALNSTGFAESKARRRASPRVLRLDQIELVERNIPGWLGTKWCRIIVKGRTPEPAPIDLYAFPESPELEPTVARLEAALRGDLHATPRVIPPWPKVPQQLVDGRKMRAPKDSPFLDWLQG